LRIVQGWVFDFGFFLFVLLPPAPLNPACHDLVGAAG
jgi:hypothetical protein